MSTFEDDKTSFWAKIYCLSMSLIRDEITVTANNRDDDWVKILDTNFFALPN